MNQFSCKHPLLTAKCDQIHFHGAPRAEHSDSCQSEAQGEKGEGTAHTYTKITCQAFPGLTEVAADAFLIPLVSVSFHTRQIHVQVPSSRHQMFPRTLRALCIPPTSPSQDLLEKGVLTLPAKLRTRHSSLELQCHLGGLGVTFQRQLGWYFAHLHSLNLYFVFPYTKSLGCEHLHGTAACRSWLALVGNHS